MTNTPSPKKISISKHSSVKTGRIEKHTHSPIKARKSLPLEWCKSETAVEKVTRWLELDDEVTLVRSPRKYAPTNYGMMDMPVRTTRNANVKATDNLLTSRNQSYFSQSRTISTKTSMQRKDVKQKRPHQNTKTANARPPRSLFRTSELLFSRAFPRLFAWLSTESDSESEDEEVYATMASKRSVGKKRHGGKIKRVPESNNQQLICRGCGKYFKSKSGLTLHSYRCADLHREEHTYDDVIDCICGDDSDFGKMVQCDGCRGWLHLACLNLTKKRLPDQYFCPRCMELKKRRRDQVIRRELNVDIDTESESDNGMETNCTGVMISGGRRWNTSKETNDDKTFMHPGNWLTMIEKRCLDVNESHNMTSDGDYDVNSNLQAADNMNWISLPTPGLFGLDQDLVSPLDSVAPSLSFSEDYSTPGPSEPPFTPEQYTIHSVDDESNEQATNGPYVVGTATDVITEAALESLIPLAELICNTYQGQMLSSGVGNEYEVQEMDRAAEEMMEYIVADDDDEDIVNTVSNNNAWDNFVDASTTL